jgi:hypothetical protein
MPTYFMDIWDMSQIMCILEGLGMKNVNKFYRHLGKFGAFCVPLVYISVFGIMYHEKSGSPCRFLFVSRNCCSKKNGTERKVLIKILTRIYLFPFPQSGRATLGCVKKCLASFYNKGRCYDRHVGKIF